MSKRNRRIGLLLIGVGILLSTTSLANPINEYYKAHKNDAGMEAKTVPPKMAALMVDDDYPEAIAVLKSLTSLKYLNFYSKIDKFDNNKIKKYAKQAAEAKGNHILLLNEQDNRRIVKVYGIKKKGLVRKLIAVVETKTQFILLIGKGKLTMKQIQYLPALSKEL